jgi:hypothetical protein
MAATVHTHPAIERMALRRKMAEAVEGLLDTVDVLLRELAKDEPDADLEPSLGAPEHPAHLCRGGGWRIPPGVFDWARGANDDREADGEDIWSVRDADEEPSLGTTFRWDQRRWASSSGVGEDREQEHDGREPSLGSVAVERWADQRQWAQGAGDDREEVCEGEGEDTTWIVPTYPNGHDQRVTWADYAGVDGWPVDPDDDPGEMVARCEAALWSG